jgi:hypothetical protein
LKKEKAMSGSYARGVQVIKEHKCTDPECGFIMRTYRRWLTPEMLAFLKALSRKTVPCGSPIHTRRLFPTQTKASTDGSYLTKWGLVERVKKGEYRITTDGKDFILGKAQASTYADIRNNEVIAWGPEVFINEIEGGL